MRFIYSFLSCGGDFGSLMIDWHSAGLKKRCLHGQVMLPSLQKFYLTNVLENGRTSAFQENQASLSSLTTSWPRRRWIVSPGSSADCKALSFV